MRSSLLVLLSFTALLGCGSDVSIGKVTVDRDSDGYDETVDCDDSRVTVNPDAPELCDGLDNDCDEAIDEDATDAGTFYADNDTDGDGYSAEVDDCDDSDASVNPGAIDTVDDGVDSNCDGDDNT